MKPFNDILPHAVVGIAGLGGLGSMVAAALARTCVGHLILCDFDRVEEANLNRQHYFQDQVGRHKVDATVENLRRINPDMQLTLCRDPLTPENIPSVFQGARVVAECLDRADQKQMLVETVLTAVSDARVVAVSGLAGYGRSNAIVTRRLSDRWVLVGDQTSDVDLGLPLTAGRVWIAAAHQANAIIDMLIPSQERDDHAELEN